MQGQIISSMRAHSAFRGEDLDGEMVETVAENFEI
jgi:hypothetical protein